MSEDVQDSRPSEMGRREHNADASAKRVVLRYLDPATGAWTNFSPATLIPSSWDYMSYTNTPGTVDTYVYKSGGSGGATVATVTVTWTDSTKTVLASVVRT